MPGRRVQAEQAILGANEHPTAGQVLHGEHAARRRRTSRNDAGAARQTVIRKGGMRKGERRQGKGRPAN